MPLKMARQNIPRMVQVKALQLVSGAFRVYTLTWLGKQTQHKKVLETMDVQARKNLTIYTEKAYGMAGWCW